MTLGARTPRDQLDRVIALVKRSFRYLWVTILVTVLGAALAIAFAVSRPRSYVSQTVFLHREVIPSNLLGGDAAGNARNMGIRFREMVLASPLLEKAIQKFDLYAPVVRDAGMNAAIEELRAAITFRTSGHGTFSIEFKGDTPDEAQKVTEHLAVLLIEWEREIQLESVSVTKKFLDEERAKVVTELDDREKVKAAFQAAPDVSPVRILLATDAASEGLNLQNHCWQLIHYEIPWNPNRMEQRNGRVDRHGQKNLEVHVYHFVGAGFDQAKPAGAPGDLDGDPGRIGRRGGGGAPAARSRRRAGP